MMSSGDSGIQFFCKLWHCDDTCDTYDISDPIFGCGIGMGWHTSVVFWAVPRQPWECKTFCTGEICVTVLRLRHSVARTARTDSLLPDLSGRNIKHMTPLTTLESVQHAVCLQYLLMSKHELCHIKKCVYIYIYIYTYIWDWTELNW